LRSSSQSAHKIPGPDIKNILAATFVAEKAFRIFDIVLYHNECYMMLLRLRTLAPWIDMHYIGFSVNSFSHEISQELTFDPFEAEIKSFFYHVFWFNYTHPPEIQDPWIRETDIRHQLVHQMELRERPKGVDLVMWSDLDEIPLPSGMAWLRQNPPENYYRFVGHFHMYNYRWRSGETWAWAYVQKYGAKDPQKTWFDQRAPSGAYEVLPGISLIHCSYCFPELGQIITKLKSFSHREFSSDQWVDPNYVWSYIYCGFSLFGGNYSFVPFDPLGIDFPDDPRFDFLKRRIYFRDLPNFKFDTESLKKYSPCELPKLKTIAGSPNLVAGSDVPNNLDVYP
jgi:hypothetical protein